MQRDGAGNGNNDPRVFLAIERTFLSWTRTSLALMGFGFVIARLGLFLREMAAHAPGAQTSTAALGESSQSLWLGTALVLLGIVVQALALAEHVQLTRRFKAGQPIVPLRWSLVQLVALVLLAAGVAMAAYLIGLA